MTSNATPCLAGSPATSNIITTTVNPILNASVSISSNASANTICAGTSVTFTATPTNGGLLPAYQWRKNTVDISGETGSTYTTTALANGDVVTVQLISNATPCLAGSPATSTGISTTVNPILNASVSISSNASSNTICAGASVTFTATPTNGGASPAYQWKKNGTDIVSATNSTYTTTELVNNDAITVVLTSNATPCLAGSPSTSSEIITTVIANLPASVSISSTATSNTICAGTSVTFTATPTNGGTTPSYQWKLNGSNTGTNSNTYTTTTLANNDLVTVVMTSGSQVVWATQNLNVSTYRDGTSIPKVENASAWTSLTDGAYCYYNNDSATYAAIYGKLYNWYAVKDSTHGGLAPAGYHIPTDAEWTTLKDTLGANAGTQMKSTTGWNSGGNGTNSSGFAGRPGGSRSNDGSFNYIGNDGGWWCSTETSNTNAWYRILFYFDSNVFRISYSKTAGFSVRCLRD